MNMTNMLKDRTTELMLRLCYHCDDVLRCDTEDKCIECFCERYFPDDEETEDAELKELFRLYAY
jgi:hypothetical protein